MKHVALSLLCLISAFMPRWVCAERVEEPAPSGNAQEAAQADTEFTLELYRRLADDNDGNLFMSGYSVMSALMLLSEGTTGPAASELGEALQLPDSAFTGDPEHPWNYAEFSVACAALERLMSPGDAAATAEVREQLSELEERWTTLRRQIDSAGRNEPPFDLIQQEQELVNQINALRQQIDPYQLRFANALWCDLSFPLRDDYLASVEANWGALAFPCDFRGNPEAQRQTINDWVAEQTNNLITELLFPGSVDEATRLILTNAVYFKGSWEEPFEASSTQEQPFILASGEQVNAMLMNDWYRWASYVELTPEGEVNDYVSVEAPAGSPFEFEWELPANPDGFKLLELPYRGGQMSMIVILPNDPAGLADVEAALTCETLAEWRGKMGGTEVNVALPRFTMRNTLMLGAPLADMGLSAIFSPGSLTGVSDSPEAEELFVGMIIQQAFVEVNEEGTEAAAATAILAPTAAADFAPKPTPEFRADHPFVYYIQDRETGAIVFMGRMTDPSPAD